jgi:sensor histidine kinase YesM
MNRLDCFAEYLFSRKRWIIHVFFWILVLTCYAVFFGRKNSNYSQTFFFISLLMPITIGTTYFLNYYLVPIYLLKERYGYFILYFIYTMLGSLFLALMIVLFTFLVMAGAEINNMSPASIDIFFLITALLMVVFFGVAIKLLLHWRQSKEEYQKLMREKVEAELKFLKAQLNPHFLFNTLNNLYVLTILKSDKAPKAILALSEILDYVMHAGKSQFVPLTDELKQVENYIALELLRYEDRVQVELDFDRPSDGCQIAPMILITLLENAFKHGVMPLTEKAWVHFSVKTNDGITIVTRNSKQDSTLGNGVGLENLKSQLNHLYKDNHSLQININKREFYLVLKLTGNIEI